MKNRWWLAGICLLVLTAVFVSMQGLATMGSSRAGTADFVPDTQENAGMQVVSHGGQPGNAPVIPPQSGWNEDPPQEGMPSNEGQAPDIQNNDPGSDFPGQDETIQEDPYEVMPPEDDYLNSLPPEEYPPAE